jgi:3-oxoacyl-[acyl-carrier-protein] synthase II
MKAVCVAADMVTAYGWGIGPCWRGLKEGRGATARIERFDTHGFHCPNAGMVRDLDPASADSLVLQMLKPLFARANPAFPADALVLLATTVGEVDLLERHISSRIGQPEDSRLDRLLHKVRALSGSREPGLVISAACASSTAAIAHAAALIREGTRDAVLVAACDSVTEFVFAGFSSLMALDPERARPFDRARSGLSVGEAAGYVLLMSEDRARREQRGVLGEVAGWGLSNDANHMTGPSRDGGGLAIAIRKALASAGVTADVVGSISAHGTGTVYNDSMELKAFRQVFGGRPRPVYGIKGGTGHTMGATGLVELIVALESLRERIVPPTVNLREADNEAAGWVSAATVAIEDAPIQLSVNSGFGGVNAALVVKRGTDD